MSWRTRFRARQYVKSSLWVAPLVAGLGGLLLAELSELVLPENRAAVDDEMRRLDATVTTAYADSSDLALALSPDHQGIGGPAIAPGALDDGTAR